MDTVTLRNYRALRESGLPAYVAHYVAKSAEEARRIGLDFEERPYDVEYNGRTLRVATVPDDSPDTSYLEDMEVSPEDYPEWYYGLTVTDTGTGEESSLWGIEYFGRTTVEDLSTRAYLFDTFRDVASEVLASVYGRTSHG